MVARIREQLGSETPRLIAPSSFDYIVGGAWVKEAMVGPGVDFFDYRREVLAHHDTAILAIEKRKAAPFYPQFDRPFS